MSTLLLLGWSFLISSWVAPYFINDLRKKRMTSLILSLISLVIFVLELIRILN